MAETVLGLALGQLLKLVEEHIENVKAFDSISKKMKSTLSQLKPIVENMAGLNQNLDSPRREKTSKLLSKIEEGQKLIDKCSKDMKGCCFCLKKARYGQQLEELHNSIEQQRDILQLEIVSKIPTIEGKVDEIMKGVNDLRGQRNSQGTQMQGDSQIGGSGSSRESPEQPEQPQSGTKEANHREKPSPHRELNEHSEQPQSGTEEANHREKLPSPPTNGASNLHPSGSSEIGRDIKRREDSHPTPTPNNGTSNLHPRKSSKIGNDVRSTGHVDPPPVDSSASLRRPSASALKEKGSLEETGKPKQLDYANPPDEKGSKGSLSGNTASLAPVAPLVLSKVKVASILHPSKSPEIENEVKPTVGHRDPSPVDSSASLHRPSASLEPASKVKDSHEVVGKPRQLEYADPPDDKVSKRSPSVNTTSLPPVAPPVPSKVKDVSNLHPPMEGGNDVNSAGRRDPSLVDFSASLRRPFASSETESKLKGFLEEAGKPRQLEYANPPDDKVNKRSLSDNTKSLASVAPPVSSKVKASPEEPYKKIIGQDSKDKGVPSMSSFLPDEIANHIPNSRKAGHSISSERNSSVTKDHIPRGHPMAPEKTPDGKIIPEE